ncbi:MAG: tetratricopeptide repeat protein [Candidatus Omnitrophota bacterium]|jgi:outer membrane protein assembly factor BamD
MRKHIIIILLAGIISTALFIESAHAYWLWTPQTKKFLNPKYAVKDSPKEQYDWAMSFYDMRDYQRAASEFEKLVKNYEYSEYASKAQYHVGLCYENLGKYYIAFQNYQKAIDNFPHIDNIDEIIARQFNIAGLYITKSSPKLMGTDIMSSADRSIEIYKKVVDNAPYGKLAAEAQFRMGDALKKAERYDEAIEAFQKVVDDYANSEFFDKAKYELAYCAYKASLKPDYDVAPTAKAIKAFEEFAASNKDEELSKEASKTVQRLKDKAAEKSYQTAKFYESQKQYASAIVYYNDILERYPESSFVAEAKEKIEALRGKAEKNTK